MNDKQRKELINNPPRSASIFSKEEWYDIVMNELDHCTCGEMNPFYGQKHTKESIEENRKAIKKLWKDPTYMKKQSDRQVEKGKGISKTFKEKWESDEDFRNMKIRIGKESSQLQKDLFENDKEYRDKFKSLGASVGLSNKGKPKSPEHIQKMKEGMAGRHKGKVFINNPELKQTKRVLKEDVQSYLDKGWLKGRVIKWD
jgi:hypothetical protein